MILAMTAHSSERFGDKLFKPGEPSSLMQATDYSSEEGNETIRPAGGHSQALDDLLHSKSRILRTKLEVLASEIHTRLNMWDRNLDRIDTDKQTVDELLGQCTRLARYHLRQQQDVSRLQESVLRLESQRREEDVQCWRDVVMVMRDFLEIWEAHEQARNRSIFINHVGTGYQNAL
jgi:hypothetical protein